MRLKRYFLMLAAGFGAALMPCTVCSQESEEACGDLGVTTLEDFRAMALEHNKQMMISREKIRKAEYQKKEAFAAYLPGIDFNGGYLYNQRNISIFDSDQFLPVKSFDLESQSYQFDLVKNPVTGEPVKNPATGEYIPSQVAYLPKDAMTYNIHHVFFGAVTLTQPVFMGGKIVAMNKLTHAAEQAARELHIAEAENVIYAVDAAYWQVVSLKAKKKLADSFVELLDSLSYDVNCLYREGVATKADVLSVDVKLNEAQVDQLKVDNGLVLSRMALAQVCGLPVNTQFTCADEDNEVAVPSEGRAPEGGYDMETVYDNRPDLRALEQGISAAHWQAKAEMSEMLPKVALVGSYEVSNPNMFDGFKRRFKGAFSVGAMVSVPLWHWGGNYNKYKAAASEEVINRLRLEEAKELVSLQVSQASFKTEEAYKTYRKTVTNLAKADENLRTAGIAFREGVATVDNVMAAQTAWLKAHSEQIDAMIDVELCQTYLSKALGTLYK